VIEVKMTDFLKTQFESDGLDHDLFMMFFAQWKSQGEEGEHDSYHFGKDGGYIKPLVNNQAYVLKHVHLMPVLDQERKAAWDKAWKHRSRKTSDRVLIYVDNGLGGFLLIAILPEPDAHRIAQQKTPQDRHTMNVCSEIAERFIDNGDVIA